MGEPPQSPEGEEILGEQIEQRAQDLWERRLFHYELLKIAHKYGFTVDEVHWLQWDVLPEKLQDHIREMAGVEIASGKASADEDTYLRLTPPNRGQK